MIDLDELFRTPPPMRVAAKAIAKPVATVKVKPPPPAVRTCNHADPKRYVDVGADNRGYIETRCRDCGGFIGYRPPS